MELVLLVLGLRIKSFSHLSIFERFEVKIQQSGIIACIGFSKNLECTSIDIELHRFGIGIDSDKSTTRSSTESIDFYRIVLIAFLRSARCLEMAALHLFRKLFQPVDDFLIAASHNSPQNIVTEVGVYHQPNHYCHNRQFQQYPTPVIKIEDIVP